MCNRDMFRFKIQTFDGIGWITAYHRSRNSFIEHYIMQFEMMCYYNPRSKFRLFDCELGRVVYE
jgi:hypothetical protein